MGLAGLHSRWRLDWEESITKLIQAVGRMQVLAVAGLSCPFSC